MYIDVRTCTCMCTCMRMRWTTKCDTTPTEQHSADTSTTRAPRPPAEDWGVCAALQGPRQRVRPAAPTAWYCVPAGCFARGHMLAKHADTPTSLAAPRSEAPPALRPASIWHRHPKPPTPTQPPPPPPPQNPTPPQPEGDAQDPDARGAAARQVRVPGDSRPPGSPSVGEPSSLRAATSPEPPTRTVPARTHSAREHAQPASP